MVKLIWLFNEGGVVERILLAVDEVIAAGTNRYFMFFDIFCNEGIVFFIGIIDVLNLLLLYTELFSFAVSETHLPTSRELK